MSRFWSPVVHDLTPYVPGEQPKLANLVKLNTNENLPPSPHVLAAIRAELGDDADRLKLYPDPNGRALKAAVAGISASRPSGSSSATAPDEVLAHAPSWPAQARAPCWFPDITYSFYPVYCGLCWSPSRQVPLADDFSSGWMTTTLTRGADAERLAR